MNQKAYKALEYYKIINMLTDKASSSMGKEICRKLEPSTDIDEIRHMQTQTRDALTRLFQKGNISFGSVKDVRGSLKRLEIGSSLGIGELLAICSLLENTNRVKAYSRSERGDSLPDSLDGMFEALEPLTPLTTEIRRCILSEDEISDDASSNLRQIRRNMKITGDRIHTRSVYDRCDLFDYFLEIPSFFCDKRRICGNTTDYTHIISCLNIFYFCCVNKKFHVLNPPDFCLS